MGRVIEATVAGLVLVVLSPLLLVLALVVRLRLGAPVLFTQSRAGLHGEPFLLYKLRTMTDARAADGSLLPDSERLTWLGRVLRATSIDELPELWNVVRGDMGLVGPRPLPVAYLPRYTAEEAHRHDMRPGITGWAQVNGRNSVGWDDRLALDVWYVEHRSFWLDVKIVVRTVGTVLTRRGVAAEGSDTMHELRPHLAAGSVSPPCSVGPRS